MNKIIAIKLLENHQVWLKFSDGFDAQINLKPFLGKGMTKDLLEKDKFNTLRIEAGGGIAFYNGYDFCPNYLRELSDKQHQITK